jgi:hypothetical protein
MLLPSFSEVLIVAIGFGIVGTYLAIAHHFIAASEKAGETDRPSADSH